MNSFILSLVIVFVFTSTAFTADLKDFSKNIEAKPHETATLNQQENEMLFQKYCIGDANSTDIPLPNYNNPLVTSAALKLSETKNLADAKLVEKTKIEIIENIKSSKEILLKQKTISAEVSKYIQDLITEIDQADVNGFTAGTTKIYELLIKEYAKEVVSSVDVLIANVKPFSFDFVSIANLVSDLSNRLEIELVSVDYKKLKNISEELVINLNKERPAVDNALILANVKIIIDELKNSKNEDVIYIVENLESIKTALEKDITSVDISDLSYQLTDVGYVFDDVEKSDPNELTYNSRNAFSLLKDQNLNLNVALQVRSVIGLIELLTNSNPDSSNSDFKKVQQKATYLVSELKSFNKKMNGLLSSEIIGFFSDFEKETNRFNSESNKQAVREAQVQFKNGENEKAVQSMNSFVKQFDVSKNNISSETIEVLNDIKKQIAVYKSSKLSVTLDKLKVSTAEASKGQFTDSIVSGISSVIVEINAASLNFNSEAKLAADKLTAIKNNGYSILDLKTKFDANPKTVQSEHFYFYSGVMKLYKLSASFVPSDAPSGTRPVAHIFLTQLCGEYRDRATMIEAKLKWANNIFILDQKIDKKFKIDINKNVWEQIPASAYNPYLEISSIIWDAKRKSQNRFMQIKNHDHIDMPVSGFTVCETKYIFSEYVGAENEFTNFSDYISGYEKYKAKCSLDDQLDYYDFRGDSNYKHYSPESNGMIWYATSIARACESTSKVKPNQNGYTTSDCQNYFRQPYFYRYNAARAGLASWLFRDSKYSDQFSSQGSMVAIYPHREPEMYPFSFSFDHKSVSKDIFEFDNEWIKLNQEWHLPDIGFNSLFGIGNLDSDLSTAYERLRDAVDRHTDWYSSGFNDKNGSVKEQAYSPFVASSYEMSESDNFTSCGITVKCPNDGLKRWMFVFRIKPENWYTPVRLANNEPIDFDKMWFDETSFGQNSLADSEKAWDRLGSPQEDELDSILYLINVELEEYEGE